MANYWRYNLFVFVIWFKHLPNHKICQVKFGKLLEMTIYFLLNILLQKKIGESLFFNAPTKERIEVKLRKVAFHISFSHFSLSVMHKVVGKVIFAKHVFF